MKSLLRVALWAVFFLAALRGGAFSAEPAGTFENPVTDSRMPWAEALRRPAGAPPVPQHILRDQALVNVRYYGFDGRIHQGQLVVRKRLVRDVREVFRVALREKFPFESVIPVSHPRFGWDDARSMVANNTSAFNYRNVPGTKKLSKHAYGRAIDINPRLNPYVRGQHVMPPGARYIPNQPGTLTPDSLLVRTFLRLGWTWGGHWKTLKDYQHFQK